jgi:hypothetical protein
VLQIEFYTQLLEKTKLIFELINKLSRSINTIFLRSLPGVYDGESENKFKTLPPLPSPVQKKGI